MAAAFGGGACPDTTAEAMTAAASPAAVARVSGRGTDTSNRTSTCAEHSKGAPTGCGGRVEVVPTRFAGADIEEREMFTPPQFWCGRDSEPIRRVTWIELFFDLVFVAAVAQLGARLADGVTFDAAWRYALLFVFVWWAWNGYAVYATRFHSDDALDWTLTLLQMLAVTFMAANAEGSLDGDDSAGFVAAYAVMRLLLVAQYLRARAVEPALPL